MTTKALRAAGVAGLDVLLRRRGGEHDHGDASRARASARISVEHLDAVLAREVEVEQHEVRPLRVREPRLPAQERERLLAVADGREPDGRPGLAQRLERQADVGLVVLHEQPRAGRASSMALEVAEGRQDRFDDLRLVRERDLLERLGVRHRQVGAGHAARPARRGGRRPAPGSARRGSRRRRRAASPPRRSRSGSSCAPTRGSCRGRAGAACAGRSPRPRSRARRRATSPPSAAVIAMREMPTIVTSSPSRRIAALPKSTTWSSSSGTSPRWP